MIVQTDYPSLLSIHRPRHAQHATDTLFCFLSRKTQNKVAPPYKVAEFDMIFGRGISSLGCMLDAADEMGVIDRTGSWYSYGEERLGPGREKGK